MCSEGTPQCNIEAFIESRFSPEPAFKILDIEIATHTD